MSGYDDIATGYERLTTTKNYGLVYTCNCGWLDLGHAFAASKDPNESAANLWIQIKAGGPDARTGRMQCMRNMCVYPATRDFPTYGYSRSTVQDMRRDGVARFPDGATGYRITTSQNMAVPVFGGKVGSTKSFLVRHNLADSRMKSVALSIFMIVSKGFERFQLILETGGVINFVMMRLKGRPYDSGFSQEDLVSNLIGFYVAVGALNRDDAINICHPVSEQAAKKIWASDGPVGKNKNENFAPVFPPSTFVCTPENPQGISDCLNQPQRFPSIFDSIKPAPIGQDFMPLLEM